MTKLALVPDYGPQGWTEFLVEPCTDYSSIQDNEILSGSFPPLLQYSPNKFSAEATGNSAHESFEEVESELLADKKQIDPMLYDPTMEVQLWWAQKRETEYFATGALASNHDTGIWTPLVPFSFALGEWPDVDLPFSTD